MRPDRWRLISQLYNDALAREAEKRAAFLRDACAGDEALRQEVEALLAQGSDASGLPEEPPVAVVAQRMVNGPSLIGRRVGVYVISEQIGAGGMGEVYRARDTKLGRDVAIKVLPKIFTTDPERLARFEREARLLAALNHPHIGAIYGFEESDGVHALVLELVDGPTLADRLATRPIPMTEALGIARQIADALDAAHEKGIVHRDLKPANIKITNNGTVKVLDFGLAKAAKADGAGPDLSQLPTATVGGTREGLILGTPTYMSPEQARGQAVDKRTDIWAFGCVLYEMLTGHLAFAGETISDTLAAILEREPSWDALPASTPSSVRQSLRRCLAKNPRERVRDIADLRAELSPLPQSEPMRSILVNRWSLITAGIALMIAVFIAGAVRFADIRRIISAPAASHIQAIAILPLKPIEGKADSIGLGLADTIITRVSQTGRITVRPTSAIRRFATQDADALAAARELDVDAVLEGTLQRAGDRLRVSVNLLRVQDGASLWADTFDTTLDEVFAMQDQVSRAIATQLGLRLDTSQAARLTKRETSSAAAYDYYTKALAYFDDRGFNQQQREQSDRAIEFLKRAVELDPDYARAHAALGYAYAWTAVFIESDRRLVELAQQEIALAARLDPGLALTHVVRAFLLWSQYEGWQVAAAIDELRAAQQLDPAVAHSELASLYFHIGLEEQWRAEREVSLKLDPTSENTKTEYVNECYFAGLPDEAHAALIRFGRPVDVRYYLAKRMLDDAAPLVERALAQTPDSTNTRITSALLLALQGKHREAEAAIPDIAKRLQRNRAYHHTTYTIARIYALGSRGTQAVHWLRTTMNEGFSHHPMFLRDPFLDRVRQDPEFVRFLAESRARWEEYQRRLK